MTAAARIGIFGGAFDPPHRAHVALAQAAMTQLALDALYVLPTGEAWHKPRGLSSAAHRLAMAQLAFADLPGVQVDARELNRAGPTYTIDTLQALRAEQPSAEFHLIVGLDQARALASWHRWQDILREAIICVAIRPDPTGETGLFPLKSDAATRLASLPDPLPTLGRFEWLDLPAMPVSATDIRQLVAAGAGITELVSAPVAGYISLHHLYPND